MDQVPMFHGPGAEDHPVDVKAAWSLSLSSPVDASFAAEPEVEDVTAVPLPLEVQVCPADAFGFDCSPQSDNCSSCSQVQIQAQLSGRLIGAVGCSSDGLRRHSRGAHTEELLAELQRERALRRTSEAELSRFVEKLQRTTLSFMASIEQQVGTIHSKVEDESRARCRAVDDLVAEVAARHVAC